MFDFDLPKTFAALLDLAEANETEPRFHGNGFAQLYLTDEHRLTYFIPT